MNYALWFKEIQLMQFIDQQKIAKKVAIRQRAIFHNI